MPLAHLVFDEVLSSSECLEPRPLVRDGRLFSGIANELSVWQAG
jgi:hypothetical protein